MLPNKLEIVKIESDFFLSGMFTVNKSSPGQKKKKLILFFFPSNLFSTLFLISGIQITCNTL